jgi:chemotaxis signal transduction protein
MTTYCVFHVGDRRIGVAMANVREIIEPHQIVTTPVPLTPPFLHGLFNLRGQIFPYLDLARFVGAQETPAAPAGHLRPSDAPAGYRAIVVEHGQFRFATPGRRIDTVDADPATFEPVPDAALHPALDAQARTQYGNFHVLQLDRLEACLVQSLKPIAVAQPIPAPATVATPDTDPVQTATSAADPEPPATASTAPKPL